ncbi:HAD family hydrolase [Paracoccus saliphilus]|uniref:HAD-IA family hydrolase n=1 Tax=Paracoccus saliphilus TaxID=405559 RepID=A0AA46A6S6_9RHOB|nr:HAD-IA family hydrolase [Paracoccus saliphilus]WCR02924.1 HAD-IA family hydrolase [Paracoccus saliphilus]SIT02881.1 haloacid dehalogenase superfamily, subfamily IA, variant 3 with third motif having DD or ED [Paracoccus saliphilus]
MNNELCPSASLPSGLVIFDCDGVLIDSEALASRLLADVLGEAGAAITSEEAHLRFTGCPTDEVLRICREDYGLCHAGQLLEVYRERLFPAFQQKLQAVQGIDRLLTRLDRPACVASNSDVERLEASLGLLPLRRYFGPHVYSAEMVASPKPAPDLVLLCLDRMGIPAGDAVMIDDSPHGIHAAATAGVAPIGFVTPGDPRPDRGDILKAAGAIAVARSVSELETVLGLEAHSPDRLHAGASRPRTGSRHGVA